MTNKQDIFEKVNDEIKRRYIHALEIRNMRIEEVNKVAPEIGMLSQKLTNTSVELTKAIIEGGSNKREIIEEIRNNNLETQKTIRSLLVEFGYSEDYLDVPYTCKKCKDTGYNGEKFCECFEELLKKYSIEVFNENSKIKLHDLSEFILDYYPLVSTPQGYTMREQMKAVYDYCIKYTEEFSDNSPSLFFTGCTGLGKTFLSSCIAKALAEKGYYVVFDTVSNILRRLESEQFSRTETNTMEVLYKADLVIVDDLGSEFINSFTSSALYNVINDRMNSEKPMIISTNYNSKELSEKYNERIISRISSFVPIHFTGNDIRQIILKKTY